MFLSSDGEYFPNNIIYILFVLIHIFLTYQQNFDVDLASCHVFGIPGIVKCFWTKLKKILYSFTHLCVAIKLQQYSFVSECRG